MFQTTDILLQIVSDPASLWRQGKREEREKMGLGNAAKIKSKPVLIEP